MITQNKYLLFKYRHKLTQQTAEEYVLLFELQSSY
jgi:hypothetical protein